MKSAIIFCYEIGEGGMLVFPQSELFSSEDANIWKDTLVKFSKNWLPPTNKILLLFLNKAKRCPISVFFMEKRVWFPPIILQNIIPIFILQNIYFYRKFCIFWKLSS